MIIIGIDLGFKGAIACIDGPRVTVFDMPVTEITVNKKKRVAYDLLGIRAIVEQYKDTKGTIAYIEKVNPVSARTKGGEAMHTSSAISNFRLGYGLAIFEMLFHCSTIPYRFIHSRTWQSSFGVKKPKEQCKKKYGDHDYRGRDEILEKLCCINCGQEKPPEGFDFSKWTTKRPVYELAHKLFPVIELATKRGRILDGRSDALMIAEYGRLEVKEQTSG